MRMINTPTPTPPAAPVDHNPNAPTSPESTTLAHDGFRATHETVAAHAELTPVVIVALILALTAIVLVAAAVIRRHRKDMTVFVALALGVALLAGAVGYAGQFLSPAGAGTTATSSQARSFEKWAEKTYSLKLSDQSATRLLDGDSVPIEQFGLRTLISAAPDSDGRIYLFNANGGELGRTSGPGVINAVPDGSVTGGTYAPGDN